MPKIRVKLFANFREFAKAKDLEIEGSTAVEILRKLDEMFPGLKNLIFKNGKIMPYVNIFLNGVDINKSGGLESRLHQNDEIAIFPPVSGGACLIKD